MAREPVMKPIRPDYEPSQGKAWSSLTVLSDQRMMSSLGRTLRDTYGDVSKSSQPSDLVRLAAMIDTRRGHTDS